MFPIIQADNQRALRRLFESRAARASGAERIARRILADVRRNGDRALARYSRRFDGVDLRALGFTVSRQEIRRAYRKVPPGFVASVRAAAKNIRAVALRQLPQPWTFETARGVKVSQQVRPLERVVCYVPGGRFPLPSTLLMCVIPAQVAGVPEVLVTSPRPAPAVLVTADLLGVSKIFRLGGAQAVAAFAYGTKSVPRADKIVGPGNRYVAAAKKIVAGECGIEFVAGPTELVVVGARGRADWIAADLVAQAEHDPDAFAILITPSRSLARRVQSAAVGLLGKMHLPAAEQSLSRQGAIVVTKNLAAAMELVNRFAPEHLVLLDDAKDGLGRVQSAGSIFLGSWSPVAAGDYASGTNHVLPTGGAARQRGGLSAADFVKTISVQELNRRGLRRLRSSIVTLARTEGLEAHAHSVEARFGFDDPTA